MSEDRLIFIAFPPDEFSDAQHAAIRERCEGFSVVISGREEDARRDLDSIEIAAGDFPRGLLFEAPRLAWFQQWSAGADWLLKQPKARECGFVITSASGIHGRQIAEHVFALILAHSRRLPAAWNAQRERLWVAPPKQELPMLAGKSLLLIGVGAIGERIARLAAAFEMTVVGVRRNRKGSVPGVTYMALQEELHEFLPSADFVVLTVPLTAETRGFFGRREFESMKPKAFFINVGRGGTVDEAALLDALAGGRLGGAGMDVFAHEPLPSESPLWSAPNMIITAHYAGKVYDYHARALEIFFDNLERYRRGLPLNRVVDPGRGY